MVWFIYCFSVNFLELLDPNNFEFIKHFEENDGRTAIKRIYLRSNLIYLTHILKKLVWRYDSALSLEKSVTFGDLFTHLCSTFMKITEVAAMDLCHLYVSRRNIHFSSHVRAQLFTDGYNPVWAEAIETVLFIAELLTLSRSHSRSFLSDRFEYYSSRKSKRKLVCLFCKPQHDIWDKMTSRGQFKAYKTQNYW